MAAGPTPPIFHVIYIILIEFTLPNPAPFSNVVAIVISREIVPFFLEIWSF